MFSLTIEGSISYCKTVLLNYFWKAPYGPDWKVCFLRAEDIFPRQFARLEKPHQHCLPYVKWHIFQAYFSNSAHLIGRCAHSSLFARGRSSARTTCFPVWPMERENISRPLSLWIRPLSIKIYLLPRVIRTPSSIALRPPWGARLTIWETLLLE